MSTNKPIFVGRQVQLAELKAHWQEVYQNRQGKVVFLAGEAGIGKTTLVQEFSRSVLNYYTGLQYAYTQCDQVTGDISRYAPFIQVLNSLVGQVAIQDDNWAKEFIRQIGPDILGLIPIAGSFIALVTKTGDFIWQRRHRGADSEPGDQQSHFGQQDIFQQFANAFRNIALKKAPLLLFIDDWQWADTSSTNLLFHLSRQLTDVPILLLAAYRPHDARVKNHPILDIRDQMHRYQLCADLSLDFLSRDEVTDYLTNRFPSTHFEPIFIDWLLVITEGNALFLTEYINLLLNEKLLAPNGHLVGDLNQISPPKSVEAVIQARIRHLDGEAQDMLAYGSVEGEEFTVLLLSHLLDIKPLPLIRQLRAIEETHQLIASLGKQTVYQQQTTVYRFVHTLIHRALYNMLEEEEREEINRLLLELRGEIYTQADETTKAQLAPQLMAHAAEAKDYLAEARYALDAAREATARYAHTEALKHCTIGLQALDKLVRSTTEGELLRMDLLLTQGDTEEFIGQWSQALATYSQAETLARTHGDKSRLTTILIAKGWVAQELVNYNQALACYERGLFLAEQAGDKVQLAEAHRGIGLIYERWSDYDRALEWYHKALVINEELSNKRGLARNYKDIGDIYENRGDYDRALEWYHKALVINEELGNKRGLARNYNNIGVIYHNRGEYDNALAWYQKSLAIDEELGNRAGMSTSYHNIGVIYHDWGEYDNALAWYQKSLAIDEELENKAVSISYLNIGLIYHVWGEYDNALAWYQKSLAIDEELGNRAGMASSYEHIGFIYHDWGEYDEALAWYQKSLAIDEELDYKTGMITLYNHVGDNYLKQGDYDRALIWHQKALALQEELSDRGGVANSYNSIGIIYDNQDKPDQALALYEKAVASNQTMGRRKELALNYSSLGALHEKQGDYEQALVWYQKALTISEELGDQAGLGQVYNGLGSISYKCGDYEQALQWYRKALSIREKLRNQNDINHTLNGIADTYVQMSDTLVQQNYSREALEAAEKGLAYKRRAGINDDNTKWLQDQVNRLQMPPIDVA